MSKNKLPHCAALARQLGERPTGTASRIRSVLLVEQAGPWAEDVRERVLAECFGPSAPDRMDELQMRLGLRALVIRRSGRQHPHPERPAVFVGGCRPGRRWLERLPVDRHSDLADLDLTEVALGPGGLGDPVAGPMLLVCAHGRKDACCAMLGRPVAEVLAAEYPEQTWQCTHFGGDRWAGNLLITPHGFMYGQLKPDSVLPVASAAQRGEVELENLRGRVGIDPFAQVAEIAIRERTGLRGLDDVLSSVPEPIGGDQAIAEVLAANEAIFRVRMRRSPLGVHGHSVCSGEAHPNRFEVLDIETPVPA